MTEYVNKAELIKACNYTVRYEDDEETFGISEARIDLMPTIDIIHCGECKHIDKTICLTSFPEKCICKIDNKSHTVDWFCADGERK